MEHFQWAIIEANLNPTVGAEQRGTRPVLIVSNEEFNQAMLNITILPLTSTRRRLYPSEVLLAKETAGLPLDSIVMAHQIRTISRQRLGKLLGYIKDTNIQHQIQDAIKEHLSLD
jgi:mRNA interferase MazF